MFWGLVADTPEHYVDGEEVGANREGHRDLAGRPSVEGEGANRKAGRSEMVVLIHFSGQSMPLRQIRSGCWVCRTSMVSPSRTEMTELVKSAENTDRPWRKRVQTSKGRGDFIPRPS